MIDEYNRSEAQAKGEAYAGIKTLTEYGPWKAGQEALCGTRRGIIRRFVQYPNGMVEVDFLPNGNRYTGIETSISDLAPIE